MSEGSLRDRLLELGEAESTGILTVQAKREIVALSLLDGEVVSADALNQSFEEGLGRVLAALGLVRQESFAALVAEHQAGGGRVVDLLEERGLVERRELLGALRQHTYELCRQVLSWTEGEHKFYAGDEVSFEEGVMPLPVVELLGRAASDLDEPSLAASGYPRSEEIFMRVVVEGLPRLEPEALRVMEALDGDRTVDEVARLAESEPERVRYWVHRWRREGLVREVGERPPAAAPAQILEEVPALDPRTPPPLATSPPPARRRWRWARPAAARAVGPWPARVLALALIGWTAWSTASAPARILAPLPWQSEQRQEILRGLSEARVAKIRRAATTFFLFAGRFPEEAADLVGLGLLAPADLEDPAGRPYRLSATAVSYAVRAGEVADGSVGAAWTGSLQGDFLLDPDYAQAEVSDEPPLVLLD